VSRTSQALFWTLNKTKNTPVLRCWWRTQSVNCLYRCVSSNCDHSCKANRVRKGWVERRANTL
jgi:hypothetical protein